MANLIEKNWVWRNLLYINVVKEDLTEEETSGLTPECDDTV